MYRASVLAIADEIFYENQDLTNRDPFGITYCMHEWTYASEWYYVHRWWKEWLTWYILLIVCMNEHVQVSDSTFTVDEKNDCHDIIFFLYEQKVSNEMIF